MKVLYSQSTQQIRSYPRIDEDSVIGLSPDYLVLTQVETTPPVINENQELVCTYVVDLNNLQYVQTWSVINLPNWEGFNTFMLLDKTFRSYRNIVRETDPDLNSALFNAYSSLPNEGLSMFKSIWNFWCNVGNVSDEHKEYFATVAESEAHHLPSDFCQVLKGN